MAFMLAPAQRQLSGNEKKIALVLDKVEERMRLAHEGKLEKPLPPLKELVARICRENRIQEMAHAYEWIAGLPGGDQLRAYDKETRDRADDIVKRFPAAFKASRKRPAEKPKDVLAEYRES